MIDSKFKERHPHETVNTIRNALFSAGIFTVEEWADSGVEGCYSVRIEIAGTHIGQNGKGVTREFALASGYAEFMERLQSGHIYVGRLDRKLKKWGGFIHSPDEKEFTIDEYMAEYGDVLKPYEANCADLKEILSLCRYEEVLDPYKDFTALPFKQIDGKKQVYMPYQLLKDVYATNGTCAGNEKYEALVQGFSEIMERNHNLRVLTEFLTPPVIPDEYLKQFQAYKMIEEIGRQQGCELTIRDCSLGTGFPVVAAVLSSRESHQYIVKFGAHPVFEIALERSLTEMLQGRNIVNAATASSISCIEKEVLAYNNIHNVLKNATGKYHYSFFKEKSDRRFEPFEDRTEMSNVQLYEYCCGLFQKWEYEVYIRYCGYLGFPAFQIVIPGFSEIYNFGLTRLKEKNSLHKSAEILVNLENATEDQIRTLYRYLHFKDCFSQENTLSYTLRKPSSVSAEEDIFGFFYVKFCLAIHLEKYREAYICGDVLERVDKKNSAMYSAFKMFAECMSAGGKAEDVLPVMKQFYKPEIIERIEHIVDWEVCAAELTAYCRKLASDSQPAYRFFAEIKKRLKTIQGEWYESTSGVEI